MMILSKPDSQRYVTCQCQCGTVKKVRIDHIRSGATRSCGCVSAALAAERGRKRLMRHGHNPKHAPTRTYRSWTSMITRCTNPTATNYARYGGRGISVCRRWKKFENFLADMGERPEGYTLDRRDNERGYSKSNCRWATPKEQAANRRSRTC